MQQGMWSLMRGIGDLLLMDCGIPAGKEFKMIVTGVIVVGMYIFGVDREVGAVSVALGNTHEGVVEAE